MTRLAGKVVTITGAGSGIGRALALELARRGCRLALSDIDAARVGETAEECRGMGAEAVCTPLDVRDDDAVDAWIASTLRQFGAVHVAINNAGVALFADATEQERGDIRRVLDVNLWGVISCSQALLPALIASGGGHLVNVSSIFGLVAVPSQSAYHASKFGVRGYTEAIAVEMAVARHPVRVSCVHPGGVATRIAADARVAGSRDHRDAVRIFDRVARTSPERAARTIVRGIERNRARILIGADAWALHLGAQLLGAHLRHLVRLGARRLLRTRASATTR
jgi:NAD(P)-dependent dehydrogenase (short-subunit alcohol dehydrogenase family)